MSTPAPTPRKAGASSPSSSPSLLRSTSTSSTASSSSRTAASHASRDMESKSSRGLKVERPELFCDDAEIAESIACCDCGRKVFPPPPMNERLRSAQRLQEETSGKRLRVDDFIHVPIPDGMDGGRFNADDNLATPRNVSRQISTSSSSSSTSFNSSTSQYAHIGGIGAAALFSSTLSSTTSTAASAQFGSPSNHNTARKEELDYFAAACKRELLALALGRGSEDEAFENVDDAFVRPRVPRSEELKLEQEQQGVQKSELEQRAPQLCNDCKAFVRGAMNAEMLECVDTTLKLRAFREQTQTPVDEPIDEEAMALEVEMLLREQSRLMAEIKDTESARACIRQEQLKLDAEEAKIAAQENKVWAESGSLKELLHVVSEKTDSLTNRISRTMSVLWMLSPIHAFNDAFFIWRDGEYGTINGFRLGQLIGRMPHHMGKSLAPELSKAPPEWEEINTAWGLSAMLLAAIAQTCGKTFPGYKIEPIGSRTTIRSLTKAPSALDFLKANKTVFPLYLDISKSNSMLDRLMVVGGGSAVENFNHAMRAFLICLKYLCDEAMKTSTGVTLDIGKKMYPIEIPDENARQRGIPPNSCKIDSTSVDLMHAPFYSPGTVPHNADIIKAYAWTKALRHVVTNLKWLLVWCVHHKV